MTKLFIVRVPPLYQSVISQEVRRINGETFSDDQICFRSNIADITCHERQTMWAIPANWLEPPDTFLEFESWAKSNHYAITGELAIEYVMSKAGWEAGQANLMLKLTHEGKLKC